MTAHRPAQIVRLSAIVFSGAASLCLTVAAGAYIVNQMPELAPRPAPDVAGPAAAPNPGHPRSFAIADSAPRGGVELAMSFVPSNAERDAARTPITAQRSGVGARPDNSPLVGRVGIGGTYVSAQVSPAPTDTVAFTIDTNLVTVAAKSLGLTPDPAAVTALHTEFDSRRGELVFKLSDPGLGSHTLRIDAPAHTPLTPGSEPADRAPKSLPAQLPTTVAV